MTLAIARGNSPGVEVRGIVDTFDRARRPAARLGQPYVPGKPIEYGLVGRPSIGRLPSVGSRFDLGLQRAERLQRIGHLAQLARWRREIATSDDRLGIGSGRRYGDEIFAAIWRGSWDRDTRFAAAIVTDLEWLVRRARAERTLIGAALPTANLPWMNAARRRIGEAD